MRGYVTRYALTEGIFVLEDAEICDGKYLTSKDRNTHHFYGPQDWYSTPEAAIERAEVMRENKIKSVRKQLEKLEKLSFAIPPQEGHNG